MLVTVPEVASLEGRETRQWSEVDIGVDAHDVGRPVVQGVVSVDPPIRVGTYDEHAPANDPVGTGQTLGARGEEGVVIGVVLDVESNRGESQRQRGSGDSCEPTGGEDDRSETRQVPDRNDQCLDVKSPMGRSQRNGIEPIGDGACQCTGEALSQNRRGSGGNAHKCYVLMKL